MPFLFPFITYHRNNNKGLITENAVQIGGPASPQFPLLSTPHFPPILKKFASKKSEAMRAPSLLFHVISAATRLLTDWLLLVTWMANARNILYCQLFLSLFLKPLSKS
jgi:hypothetical protein